MGGGRRRGGGCLSCIIFKLHEKSISEPDLLNNMCFQSVTEVADHLSISAKHCVLAPDQPVPVLTLLRQALGQGAFRVPIFKSIV